MSKQDFSSKYYYVYNYSHVVGLVKSASQAAYADLANQAPAGDASPLFATVAPYLDLDFQSKLVILNAEQNLYDEVYTSLSTVNSVKVYVSKRL